MSYARSPRRTLLYVRADGVEVALALQGRHADATVGACLALYEARVQPSVICNRYDVPRNVLEDWCRRAGVIRSEAEAAHIRYVHECGLSLVALGHRARPLYEGDGLSLQQVADRLGCSRSRVHAGLAAAAVPLRARGQTQRRARRPAAPMAAPPSPPPAGPATRHPATLAERLAHGGVLRVRRAGGLVDATLVEADGTRREGYGASVVADVLRMPGAVVERVGALHLITLRGSGRLAA